MTNLTALSAMGMLGAFLICASAGVFFYALFLQSANPINAVRLRYEASLENETRFQLLETSGKKIARVQIAAGIFLLVSALALRSVPIGCLAFAVAFLPQLVLRSRSEKRVHQLEEQLDSWLVILANALRSSPAIGDAIISTVSLVPVPTQQEIDLFIKEYQLGVPVDRAIANMADRSRSVTVSGALAALVISRQTGGNVPEILETSAASLREAARLDGVVRTKTAEARGQLMVLAVMPLVLVGIISVMQPGWFDSLTESSVGNLVLLAAVALWAFGLFWARQILKVDI
ncbi:MAG: type II secretion system F family protein [Polyangiales bacterium]